MPYNMSYCQFENTLGALREIVERGGFDEHADVIGKDEATARQNLLNLMRDLVAEDDEGDQEDDAPCRDGEG